MSDWLTINPLTGSGDGKIDMDGTKHTGRLQRVTDYTVEVEPSASGTGDNLEEVIEVTQLASAEFVTINDINAQKNGGTVTMTGKTNSSKLTFTLGTGGLAVTLPGTYLAGGASTANGANVAGDPGASTEFAFSIAFTVPANTTINERLKTIIVTAAGGQSDNAKITQAAGDAYIRISRNAVTMDANGTRVSIDVESNGNWKVKRA